MYSINRVGQKVRCIEAHFRHFWCPDVTANGSPEYDGEYTVSGFEDIQGYPGIHLSEFTNTHCDCSKKKLSWPMKCFVPLVDDEAENEYVTEIINKAKDNIRKTVKV